MSQYELGGSIILRDAFSASLDALEAGVKSSEQIVSELGRELDGIGSAPNVDALLTKFDRLGSEATEAGRAMQQLGKGLQTTVASERVRQLEAAIGAVQAKARQGIKLTVKDVGDLQEMNAELARLKSGLEQASGASRKTSGVLTSLVAGFGAFGIAMGGQQLLSGIANMTTLGAKAQTTERIFRNLTQQQGVNADQLLASLQKATHGSVQSLELMTQANRVALSLGAEGLAQLPGLAQGARSAALAQGESVSFMLNSVVEGVRKASPELLDNLGLTLRVGEANQQMADSLGKTVDALTAQERSMALLNAASEALADFQKKIGEGGQTTTDDIQSLAAAWADLKVAMGQAIVRTGGDEFLAGAAQSMRDFADTTGQALFNEQIKFLVATTKEMKAAGENVGASNLAEQINEIVRSGLPLPETNAQLKDIIQSILAMETGADPTRMDALVLSISNLAALVPPAAAALETLPDYIRDLGAESDSASPALGRLEAALLRVVGATRAWATIPMQATAMDQAIGNIESKLVGLAGAVDKATLTGWRDKAVKDLETMFRGMGSTTKFGMDVMVAEYMQGWDTLADGVREKQRGVETDQAKHVERLFESAGDLRSSIEAALNQGMEVTAIDFELTAAGQYKDKVKESALRLQAIAERGFAELQVHPDWASALKIPQEVLAGGEAQLKAWAGQTSQAVKDNLRPDLINWDAFAANFQKGLEDQAAKELTIDIAVGELQARGLDTTDMKGLRDQIAESMGLKAPSMTIDALFQTETGAGARMVKEITGGLPALPVPVTPTLTTTSLGVTRAEEAGATTTATLTTTIQSPDLGATTQTGNQAGAALSAGFTSTAVEADVGTIILGAWTASLQLQMNGFYSVGNEVGSEVAAGLLDAAKRDLNGFQGVLVGILLPPLEAALRRSRGGRGDADQ